MKAAFKITALLLFLVSTSQLAAASQLTFEYKYEYTVSFMLKMEGLQNETHYIRIKDENGTILFNERSMNQDEFQRMYNLENLPAGAYTVIIENEHKLVMQPVLMNGRFLKIDTTEQKEVYKPVLSLKETAVVINILHFEKSPIIVSLKDKANTVIYREEFKTYGSLNKQLNIAKLTEGEYWLEIATENYSIVKNIDTTNHIINSVSER